MDNDDDAEDLSDTMSVRLEIAKAKACKNEKERQAKKKKVAAEQAKENAVSNGPKKKLVARATAQLVEQDAHDASPCAARFTNADHPSTSTVARAVVQECASQQTQSRDRRRA